METNRRRYIEQGLMADPDKPTTLDHAITPVGTCTEMCPENERVDRMYEMQFELAESVRAGCANHVETWLTMCRPPPQLVGGEYPSKVRWSRSSDELPQVLRNSYHQN